MVTACPSIVEDEEKVIRRTFCFERARKRTRNWSLRIFDPKQHFTQPPAHYTEAALVKAMEEQGIGRPSTYSPTITTILARRYVVKGE